RGGPGAAAGAGASAIGFAPSATGGGSGDGSFGGVREVRFGPAPPVGGGVFGIKRRVISPCPTVQRLVVIQYSTSPVGKRAMRKMNAKGKTYISTRCDCCIVPLMKYVQASWL